MGCCRSARGTPKAVMVTLPLGKPSIPASLANAYGNGALPIDELVPVGEGLLLHRDCAHAWLALVEAVQQRYGWTLDGTEGYRNEQIQKSIFLNRYSTTPIAGSRDMRIYEGQVWYLRIGFDLAAVPKTSNHGWGYSIDACANHGGRVKFTDGELAQLVEVAPEFGFLWEVKSEPWHLVYVLDHPWPPIAVPLPEPEKEEEMANGFQILDDSNNITIFIYGNPQSVNMGNLPNVHGLVHRSGQIPLLNADSNPIPASEVAEFARRWAEANQKTQTIRVVVDGS